MLTERNKPYYNRLTIAKKNNYIKNINEIITGVSPA